MHPSITTNINKRPTQNDFDVEIISRQPDSDGRKLSKFTLDGIATIGAVEREPFEVHFKNNSWEDVQVRISLDGTDVLTGKVANLEINHEMWFVKAGRTLHLKAWHENQEGGSKFVFTGADKSVALHTHGDVSHKGIIAVAVFVENEPKPRYEQHRLMSLKTSSTPLRGYPGASISPNSALNGTVSGTLPETYGTLADQAFNSTGTLSDQIHNSTPSAGGSISEYTIPTFESSMRKEVSIGAGEYIPQKTHTVKGLDNPVFNSIIRVRYDWWENISARVKTLNTDPHPTGFPGDKPKTFADLSNVPKVESSAISRTIDTASRFV